MKYFLIFLAALLPLQAMQVAENQQQKFTIADVQSLYCRNRKSITIDMIIPLCGGIELDATTLALSKEVPELYHYSYKDRKIINYEMDGYFFEDIAEKKVIKHAAKLKAYLKKRRLAKVIINVPGDLYSNVYNGMTVEELLNALRIESLRNKISIIKEEIITLEKQLPKTATVKNSTSFDWEIFNQNLCLIDKSVH